MRLIDADVFKEMLGEDTNLRKNICRMIDDQPTAYDVEKVVAKLNKALGKLLHICSMEDVEKVYNFYDLMEEIVRKGGVE